MTEYGSTLVTGLTNGAIYAVLGVTFALIFFVTGRFHFAYGLFYSLAGVLCAWGVSTQGWSLGLAMVVGVVAATIGGVASELLVYRAFDRRAPGLSLLGVFIASLGIVVAGQAAMYLVFNEEPSYYIDIFDSRTWVVGSIVIPVVKLATVVFCVAVLLGLAFMRTRTSLGRKMRAIEANKGLAEVYGIRVDRIYLVVFAIATPVSAVLGILYASTYAATPSMGEAVIVYAFVVAFLGRDRGVIATAAVGFALGIAEALIGQWFGLVLRNLAVFIVLFSFVAAQPFLRSWRTSFDNSRRRRLVPETGS